MEARMTYGRALLVKSFLLGTSFKQKKIKTKRNKILCKFYILSGITDQYITVNYTLSKYICRNTTKHNNVHTNHSLYDLKHEFNILSAVYQNAYSIFRYKQHIDKICETNLMKPISLYVQPKYIKTIQTTIMNEIYKEAIRLVGV